MISKGLCITWSQSKHYRDLYKLRAMHTLLSRSAVHARSLVELEKSSIDPESMLDYEFDDLYANST